MLLAFLTYRAGQFHKLRHFKSNLLIDDLTQRYVGCSQVAGIIN